MAEHNKTGQWGERLAVELLVKKGYAIVQTGWRMNKYEIDIIAMHGTRIVFVEVKTRSSLEDIPEYAVDRKKINRIVAAANTYMQTNDLPHEVQYDIIAVSGTPQNYRIEHIEDAFRAPLRTYR